MVTQVEITVREATGDDSQKLANLIHFEQYVHRHLDWRAPLDWIGSQPYLVSEEGGKMMAALACPPDPVEVAWVRLFAVSSRASFSKMWNHLWPAALESLRQMGGVQLAAAIPLQRWFEGILTASDFEQTHRVVMLSCSLQRTLFPAAPIEMGVRPMNFDDLAAVQTVDSLAFPQVWRHSQDCLEMAFRQAAFASVVEKEGQIVGYQISTATPLGGHLARLAIHPDLHNQGLGYSLLLDVLSQFSRRGAQTVTVNTQHDNLVSLNLYEKAGFRRTGEEYPVYQYFL